MSDIVKQTQHCMCLKLSGTILQLTDGGDAGHLSSLSLPKAAGCKGEWGLCHLVTAALL